MAAGTNITITTGQVFSACETLSKYTGREQRDANGNSMFEQILIQDRDLDLIAQYAEEAAVELNKWLFPFFTLTIGSTEEADSTNVTVTTGRVLTWTPDPTYAIPGAFDNLIKQYITNWCMGMWMRDKVPERAEYFQGEAERLGASLPSKIFRAKP